MKIAVSFLDGEFLLRDLIELAEAHTKEIIIDGDRREIIIVDPDEFLLGELENRGINYEVIET